jgi:hypothetical protein
MFTFVGSQYKIQVGEARVLHRSATEVRVAVCGQKVGLGENRHCQSGQIRRISSGVWDRLVRSHSAHSLLAGAPTRICYCPRESTASVASGSASIPSHRKPDLQEIELCHQVVRDRRGGAGLVARTLLQTNLAQTSQAIASEAIG